LIQEQEDCTETTTTQWFIANGDD